MNAQTSIVAGGALNWRDQPVITDHQLYQMERRVTAAEWSRPRSGIVRIYCTSVDIAPIEGSNPRIRRPLGPEHGARPCTDSHFSVRASA